MKFSLHFQDMLRERNIRPEWIELTISEPDATEDRSDGTKHYKKQIPDNGNRWLRVVVNVEGVPPVCVTAFFDRRLGRLP